LPRDACLGTVNQIRSGCARIETGNLASEAAYRERFADAFNFATLPFHWWSYEAARGQPIHERTEQVARWCQEQRIVCEGHPLAWNYAEPRWLPDDSQQVLELQRGRITDCVTCFRANGCTT
jgi:GH35 family endo-1,4-beta-xylanase